MIFYVLDTNIISYCLKGLFDIERKFDAVIDHGDIMILSPITLYEIMRGLYAVKAKRRIALFEKLCLRLEEQEFIKADWLEAARLFAVMENSGHPMSESDLLQAAFCIRNNYTLVTHNIKHFSHIENLSCEDWVL
jgi:tRNA(fMet)-specific endonuclease VapC